MLAAAVVLNRYDNVGKEGGSYFSAVWLSPHMSASVSGTAAPSQSGALRKLADALDKEGERRDLMAEIDATP